MELLDLRQQLALIHNHSAPAGWLPNHLAGLAGAERLSIIILHQLVGCFASQIGAERSSIITLRQLAGCQAAGWLGCCDFCLPRFDDLLKIISSNGIQHGTPKKNKGQSEVIGFEVAADQRCCDFYLPRFDDLSKIISSNGCRRSNVICLW